jgi:hypothetical protein
LTNGQDTWRARYAETHTPGSEGGPGKRTGGNTGTAPGAYLTELQRSGQYPGAIDALRRVLTHHQPTAAGRCRTCARIRGRRRRFPCIVWHQIYCDLLGLFAGAGRHRQPAGQGSSPHPNERGTAPTTATTATGGR